jgi:hypothetical protein
MHFLRPQALGAKEVSPSARNRRQPRSALHVQNIRDLTDIRSLLILEKRELRIGRQGRPHRI